MARHKDSRILRYSPQQVFELVAQVERYPEFLPLWREARVSQDIHDTSGNSIYLTDQVIQFGPVRRHFRTRTRLREFTKIHVESSDTLFRRFSIDWLFSDEDNDACRVEFMLDCEAASPFLRPVFDVALLEMAQTIVTAFENRAKYLYRNPA